jgi:hypothetical protein
MDELPGDLLCLIFQGLFAVLRPTILTSFSNCRLVNKIWRRTLDSKELLPQRRILMEVCCILDQLESLKWLVMSADITAKDAHHALWSSCEYGHLETAKWLVSNFSFTTKNAHATINTALRKSCENGHLETAKWLVEMFKLTEKDARVCNNYALRKSCGNGHLETAKWLVERFKLTKTVVLINEVTDEEVIEWLGTE